MIQKIKKGDAFIVDELLLERSRFDKEDYVVWKVIYVNVADNYMKLQDIKTGRIVGADIDCHHSQGSRYTWLTYKINPTHPYVLFYGQEI